MQLDRRLKTYPSADYYYYILGIQLGHHISLDMLFGLIVVKVFINSINLPILPIQI